MKEITIKLKFKSRLELFILNWKVGRKFPNYSIRKELIDLFFPKPMKAGIF